MKLSDMNILLTGACGGIGQALARELASGGASLFLTGRNLNALSHLKEQLETDLQPGQQIVIKAIDLTNSVELESLIKHLEQMCTPVNTLVNNAGVLSFDLLENMRSEDIERVMHLNTVVTMKLTNRLLPALKTLSRARIVNIASTFGAIGFPGYSVYSASKFAVRGFSEALSRELSDSEVSVGCFLPRATRTPINSSQVVEMNEALNVSMDSPEVLAKTLATFIASDKQFQASGWPEKLLVKLNSVCPTLVGYAIKKQLPVIKRYAVQVA